MVTGSYTHEPVPLSQLSSVQGSPSSQTTRVLTHCEFTQACGAHRSLLSQSLSTTHC